MFTIAAPSMMLTCTLGLDEFPCEGTRSSKHPRRSDLVPVLMCDNDGGHAWFSCSKNSSIFPSRICDAMYNLEKREQSFFRDESCCWDLDFSLTGHHHRRGCHCEHVATCMVLQGSSLTMPTKFSYHIITAELEHVNRVDVVWDEYLPDSLKAETCMQQERE